MRLSQMESGGVETSVARWRVDHADHPESEQGEVQLPLPAPVDEYRSSEEFQEKRAGPAVVTSFGGAVHIRQAAWLGGHQRGLCPCGFCGYLV